MVHYCSDNLQCRVTARAMVRVKLLSDDIEPVLIQHHPAQQAEGVRHERPSMIMRCVTPDVILLATPAIGPKKTGLDRFVPVSA